MNERKTVMRAGSTIVKIRCYAAGDGMLSFVAHNTHTNHADAVPPTEEEARAVCPYGWVLFQEGENWRAREAT